MAGTIIKRKTTASLPGGLTQVNTAEIYVTSIVKNKEEADNKVLVNKNCVASNPDNKANAYFVNSLPCSDEECEQEQQSKSWSPDPTINDITQDDVERLERPGAAPINTQRIERISPADQAMWIEAMREEMNSLDKRDAYEEVTAEDLHKKKVLVERNPH